MADIEQDNDSSDSENSNDANEYAEEKEEEVTEQERENIRNKLSNMSFEDLQKLKNDIGSKLYNQTVFAGVDKKGSKTNFKRANKNRPREMSSKIRYKQRNQTVAPIKKQICRDPRFDPLCGSFDNKIFQSNYKFVTELKKKERDELEKEYNETTDFDRKKQIKYLIQRTDNQIREQEKKEKEDEQVFEERREIKERLKRGEKPQFKKKSVKKLEQLIDKYEQLKKTNKLQKHIEKRSKKLSTKNRKNLERQNLI